MADDRRLVGLLAQIESLGYGTPEYHDAMAFLFVTVARSQWRRADQARAAQRDAARRAAKVKRPPQVCPVCRRPRAVRDDGTFRQHDAPSGTVPCPGSRQTAPPPGA